MLGWDTVYPDPTSLFEIENASNVMETVHDWNVMTAMFPVPSWLVVTGT